MTLAICGGHLRGRRLAAPDSIRPTESRVREALFSIVGEEIAGARVADLFAGSGAIGFEALSRGASQVLFVDATKASVRTIHDNARALHIDQGRYSVRILDLVRQWLPSSSVTFDLIFLDPPYALELAGTFLDRVALQLSSDGHLVYEHDRRRLLPPTSTLHHFSSRRYGETMLTFYRRQIGALAQESWHD